MGAAGTFTEPTMISAAAIAKIAPAGGRFADELVRQMAESGIMANAKRASMFLGQIHVESGGFRSVIESLNYAADSAMMRRFIGWGRITAAEAHKWGRTSERRANQEALANRLYGGEWGRENLGNTEAGDGWAFRGRGLKQLTGRDNYRRFSRAWLGDESLLAHPERVAASDGAVASAVWFWLSKELNQVADRGTVSQVTRLVNGGQVGLPERIQWTDTYRQAWREADFSNVRGGSDTVPNRA